MASLVEKIKAGAKVFDVRTTDEFQDEHYPNAINIPVNELPNRLAEFGEKDKPVIVYCASGARSAYAAQILRASGYADVTNAGGIADMMELM